MLVEQEQDLRNWNPAWKMSIFQLADGWQVLLSKYEIDGPVIYASANNPKRAFKDALKKAKAYEEKLSETGKKSS